jgi:hypothetical protein
MDLTPEQKDKYLKAIEKIEQAPRPKKWRLIKDFTLELKPWLKDDEAGHSQACKELRQQNENKHAASKSGTMRSTMKLYGPVYNNLLRMDPQLREELSGRNKGDQTITGKKLWDAFPEWRTCREF